MMTCGNYNGWADLPEEEREGLDAFEATRTLPVVSITRAMLTARTIPQRKAA
jgi:hypothetical protein